VVVVRGEDVGDGRDEELRNDLRQFLRERFLSLNPSLEFADTDNLADLGVLDSLAFVELVDEVQQRYGITVSDDEITETNFGSIASIGDYVKRRRLP
jgi:acyl carrier protein